MIENFNLQRIGITTACLLLAGPAPADAAAPDVYVAPSGSDANACTASAPCASVAAAVQRVASGGTVNIERGHYLGRVEIPTGKALTLRGAGVDTLLDAQQSGSTVYLPGNTELNLADLTITGGQASFGAGILSLGKLTLTRVQVGANVGAVDGGGIYSTGDLSVKDSQISLNQAGMHGGGICSLGKLLVERSLISANHLVGDLNVLGAGLFLAQGIVKDSTIWSNSAPTGSGGAIAVTGSLVASHLTIVHNTAAVAGGIVGWGDELEVSGSILAANPGGDCRTNHSALLLEHDLFGDGGCTSAAGDPLTEGVMLLHAEPRLGTLSDNGGPTRTLATSTDSLARDAIPADDAACEGTDQRGLPRRYPNSTGCDIGAFQRAPPGQLGSLATGTFPALTPNDATLSNIELTNTGGDVLGVATLQVSGDAFTLLATDCFQGALNPGEHCTARVQFQPPNEGTHAGWLTATDDVGGNPLNLALSGAGVAIPTNTALPSIDESQARLADGSWLLGKPLLAEPGTWAGYAPLRFTFVWQRCEPVKGVCGTPSVGGEKYVLGRDDEGHFLRLSVRARNQRGWGEPAFADTPVVKLGL